MISLTFIFAFWSLLCVALCSSTHQNSTHITDGQRKKSLRGGGDEFDWIGYLLAYKDLRSHFSTKEEAWKHYLAVGKHEKRRYSSALPFQPGFNQAVNKVLNFLAASNSDAKRNIVLYNIHPLDTSKSSQFEYELLLNNLQMFLVAVIKDNSENSGNFYWCNIINPSKNPFSSYVKSLSAQSNVAVVESDVTPHNLFGHLRSLAALHDTINNKFEAIMFLSNHVRGPLVHGDNGLWVRDFSNRLHEQNVGLVGATMDCVVSNAPIVHSHAIMIHTNLLDSIVNEFVKFKQSTVFTSFTQEGYEIGITKIARDIQHMNIASLLQFHRMKKTHYKNGACLPSLNTAVKTYLRCDLQAEEVIFFHWDSADTQNYYEKQNCEDMLQQMTILLNTWKQQHQLISMQLLDGAHEDELHRSMSLNQTITSELKVLVGTNNIIDIMEIEHSRKNFDWRAYLEFYTDIGSVLDNKEDAFQHYLHNGHYENRIFPKLFPFQPELSIADKKIQHFWKVSKEERTCVIYNVHAKGDADSYEVTINNIMIFRHAIQQDASLDSTHFYWINIIGENNLYSHLVLDSSIANQWNVAIVTRSLAPSDMFVHLRTFSLLKQALRNKFTYVFCLHSGSRGPLHLAEHGHWLRPFQDALTSSTSIKIGLVGATLSCTESTNENQIFATYIPTHAFMIRTTILPILISEFGFYKRVTNKQKPSNTRYEIGFSQALMKHGWKVASLLHTKRFAMPYYNGTCIIPNYPTQSIYVSKIINPSLWCNLLPEEVIFYHWNAQFFSDNYICPELRQRMTKLLTDLQINQQNSKKSELRLHVSEVLKSSELKTLHRDYHQETTLPLIPMPRDEKKPEDQVCFLSRTFAGHDTATAFEENQRKSFIDIFDDVGIEDFVKGLDQNNLIWCFSDSSLFVLLCVFSFISVVASI